MLYAISDIHGCLEEFEKILAKINLQADDTLYVLGDIIDRGPEPLKLISMIMNMKNTKMILGNHEDMMLQFYENSGEKEHERWMRNGGAVTQAQFESLSSVLREEILGYFKSMPLYYLLDKFLLVHAGLKVPAIEAEISNQSRRDLIWIRNEFFENKTGLSKVTVFGHTPTVVIKKKDGDAVSETGNLMKIWHDEKHGDKIGIDCGAVYPEYGGRLACLGLDDFQEFYV